MWKHKQWSVRLLGKRIIGEKLLYLEQYAYVFEAIKREKQLKALKRPQKEKLISSLNPDRVDVAQDWYAEWE
jgi:putative endonuclease